MKRRSRPPSARSARPLHRAGRYAAWAFGLLLALLTAGYVAARMYLVPTVLERKVDIEAWLAETLRHPVSLGRIEPDWDGLSPGVRVWGATVYGEDGRSPSIRVGEMRVSVAPLPLLWGQVEIYRLVVIRPSLTVNRDADGRVRVAGFALGAEARTDAPGAGFGWLLGQPRVVVREGELRWVDVRDPGGPLLLSQIEMSLRNAGERHRLTLSARFPPAVCRACSVSADVTGIPNGNWDGEVGLRVQALDVRALPLVLRERLPADARGRFDAELRGDWRDGRLQAVQGEVAANGLQLPLGAERHVLGAQGFAAGVSWRTVGRGWRLELRELTLGLMRTPWTAGRLRLEHTDAENRLELERLEIDDVTAFAAKHRGLHPLLARWAELRPSGRVNNLKVTARGPLDAPQDYAVRADLAGLSALAYERMPGASGLSGHISFDAGGGRFALDSRNFSFHLPKVFRGPLAAARASGLLQWRRAESGWRIDASDLKVQSEDGYGSGAMTLELPFDSARSPVLRLRADFRDGNGAHAARYYPVYRLSPRVLAWMESAFVDGRITSGHLVYDGPIREFPFEAKQGRFELRAQVRDGVYRYLPGWIPLTEAEADVAIDGANAVITGRGKIGKLQAHGVRVEIAREDGAPGRSVRVKGEIDGPVAETVRVLRAVKSDAAWLRRAEQIAHADGTGALALEVHVPLRSERGPSFLAAYRLQGAALKLDNGTGLEAASGVIRFTEAGLRDATVRAQLFGGPVALAAATDSAGELRLQANGTLLVPELLRTRPKIAERVSGAVDWSLAWHDRRRGPQLRFESDLRAVRTRLPPPLDRRDAGSADRLLVTTESSGPDELMLRIDAGAAATGKLVLGRVRNAWSLQKGRVDIGRPAGALPAQEGLALGLRLGAVDVDQWMPLLERNERSAPLTVLSGVTAEIERLSLLNRDWGRTFLHFVRSGTQWRSVIDSEAAAGEASFEFGGGTPTLRLDLAYLRLPERKDVAASGGEPADPRRLPTVELHARSFEYKRRKFGELSFGAVSHPQGWRIERLSVARPETNVAVSGYWRRIGERETSDFSIELNSDDMGATLDAWGAAGQMANGKVKVQANLSWPGSPMRPSLAGLDGNIEVAAEKGRFLRFDPGAARLFGLLDLRSIGRYLTLDFSSALGKGFAFDVIHGAIAIERGNASTNNLIVQGPALSLGVTGRVGLASEDYDLVLQASPRVSDTLTFTSWGLFGPQVAAAVLALQKIFKHQIQEGTRITYLVKGSWDNPTVTKVAKTPPAESRAAESGQ